MQPLLTVILPVYNGGPYLRSSVQSVLEQTESCFEFLILDDASTDSSYEYLNTLKDKRIAVYKNECNKGLFHNLNFLIRKSSSPLIKLWAQDDVMNTNCLAQTVIFHRKYPQLGFSYSDRETINERGDILINHLADNTPEILTPEMHARISLFTGSIAGNIANVCISKKALDEVGPFNEEMRIAADFDMWVRLAKDHDTGFINQKLVRLRNHPGQLSRNRLYHIHRPVEDMQVFNYLLGYVSKPVKTEGLNNLRKYKFVYYYTLMVKAVLYGRFKTFWLFLKEIWSFGSFFTLSYNFLRSKITPLEKPGFIKTGFGKEHLFIKHYTHRILLEKTGHNNNASHSI